MDIVIFPAELSFTITKADIEASHKGGYRSPINRAIMRTFPYIKDVSDHESGVYLMVACKFYYLQITLAHNQKSMKFWKDFDGGNAGTTHLTLELKGIKGRYHK